MHKTGLNRVVDETPRSCGLGAKQLGGERYGGGGRKMTKDKK